MTERRSFPSRTPAGERSGDAQPRRAFVTRHQTTGWRFLLRRLASGLAARDTRMLVDPLRDQRRSLGMGALLCAAALVGCFLFSLIRPVNTVGGNSVVADRSTLALYVKVGEKLHPVLNLASARLIAGKPDDPVLVSTSDLDKYPRGSLLGIPGAPARTPQSEAHDADWTVCDALDGPVSGTTVLVGPPAVGGDFASALPQRQAILVTQDGGASAWLLWQGRRSRIDLADHAITAAIGLGVDSPAPRPVSRGLFNLVPEGPALAAPEISGAGSRPKFPLPGGLPVGAVAVSRSTTGGLQHYLVLADGLQQIPPTIASIVRNNDAHGLASPPVLAPDIIAKAPVAHAVDTDDYPASPVVLVDPEQSPVACARWTRTTRARTSSLVLLAGAALPVDDKTGLVSLVGGGRDEAAEHVAVTPGSGLLVQVVGQEPRSTTREALFWISDNGVRYGVDRSSQAWGTQSGGEDKTIDALGLRRPALPIPWAVLSLLAPGPALSREDALLAHDSVDPDLRPGQAEAEPNQKTRGATS